MERYGNGWIEIITGPMFSGKSEELIRRLRRVQFGKQFSPQYLNVFKPEVDNRDGLTRIASRANSEFPARPIPTSGTRQSVRSGLTGPGVIAFDEIQFFEPDIVDTVEELANDGFRVICAGLNQTLHGPFGSMPTLMAMADEIVVLTAICTVCGRPATKTQNLVALHEGPNIGGEDKFTARCRQHYEPI